MTQDTQTEFEAVRDYLEGICRKGGETTLERYGTEHFRQLGKQSAAKRKARREAEAEHEESLARLQRWADAVNKEVND